MKTTRDLLKTGEWKGACRDGAAFALRSKEENPLSLLRNMIDSGNNDQLDWANWGISRLLSRIDKVKYAIFAAESVLHIFEKNNDSKSIRMAIETTKAYVKNPNKKTTVAARAAAAYTTDVAAAAVAAIANANDDNAIAAAAAAYATDAAVTIANANANDANAYTADAATYAIDAVTANADDDAADNLRVKTLEYGLKLLTS